MVVTIVEARKFVAEKLAAGLTAVLELMVAVAKVAATKMVVEIEGLVPFVV